MKKINFKYKGGFEYELRDLDFEEGLEQTFRKCQAGSCNHFDFQKD